jgi:hypothetical protein
MSDQNAANYSALADEIRKLREQVADYEHSFQLYHQASMALMHAYKRAHPEVPDNVWPDVGQVNQWAAEQIAAKEKKIQ